MLKITIATFVAFFSLVAPAIANAHNIVINCHRIQRYSHSQVHFGLSMIGNRVPHSEKQYLHEKYPTSFYNLDGSQHLPKQSIHLHNLPDNFQNDSDTPMPM